MCENDTYIGFAHWSLLCGVLVANSREWHLRAQEKEPAVDVREGFALAWPFIMTCRETNTTCSSAFLLFNYRHSRLKQAKRWTDRHDGRDLNCCILNVTDLWGQPRQKGQPGWWHVQPGRSAGRGPYPVQPAPPSNQADHTDAVRWTPASGRPAGSREVCPIRLKNTELLQGTSRSR